MNQTPPCRQTAAPKMRLAEPWRVTCKHLKLLWNAKNAREPTGTPRELGEGVATNSVG